MEVILIQDVQKKGKLGDKITVKQGYANNYLFPLNLAIPLTKANEARFKSIHKAELKQREKNRSTFSKLAKTIDDHTISIHKQTHQGKLYGSISPKDIIQNINNTFELTITREQLDMPDHIKEVGKYSISLQLQPDISCKINLLVESSSEVVEPTNYSETDEGKQDTEDEELNASTTPS